MLLELRSRDAAATERHQHHPQHSIQHVVSTYSSMPKLERTCLSTQSHRRQATHLSLVCCLSAGCLGIELCLHVQQRAPVRLLQLHLPCGVRAIRCSHSGRERAHSIKLRVLRERIFKHGHLHHVRLMKVECMHGAPQAAPYKAQSCAPLGAVAGRACPSAAAPATALLGNVRPKHSRSSCGPCGSFIGLAPSEGVVLGQLLGACS